MSVASLSDNTAAELAGMSFGAPAQEGHEGFYRHLDFCNRRQDIDQIYSRTSSTLASTVGGSASPSACAALRLITSLYLVEACTGRSAGFSPLRMRSTYPAARRNWSVKSAP